MKEKILVAHNPNKPHMCYDFPHLFSEETAKDGQKRVEILNKRGPKGWVLIEMEDY